MTVGKGQKQPLVTIDYQVFSNKKLTRSVDNMKYGKRDVKPLNPCKKDHKHQFVEKDKKGYVWQLCVNCARKLLVR